MLDSSEKSTVNRDWSAYYRAVAGRPPRDTWATVYPNMTHYPKTQIEELLQAFDVEYFEEEEHHGETAIGEQKYWHIFHIVACKK